MSVLKILEYPDPKLRTRARPVETVDAARQQLIDDMFETMYAAPGIGLAATQVDFHERILVLDISDTKDQPLCFVNPEIVQQEGSAFSDEGCLSVPGFTDEVERAEKIRVRALNKQGESFELEAEGLLAVCIQHEMDHLEGKLFVDYLSELKRLRIKKKAQKQRKRFPDRGSASTPAI
ncbi:MAG: peptide deformylase [Gammaproteobacteria bacterium]|nr:peptide deformylase [Gammaproteobacteria bacterium]